MGLDGDLFWGILSGGKNIFVLKSVFSNRTTKSVGEAAIRWKLRKLMEVPESHPLFSIQ